MGVVCCQKRKPIIHPLSLPPQLPDPQRRKEILFRNESSEQSFTDLTTPRNGKLIRWKRGELLGEGTYAKVYQCMNIETGCFLAVKHFHLGQSPSHIQKVFHNTKKEIALLKELNHPNIVQYFQTDLSPNMNSVDIILEYVPGGSLKSLLLKYGALTEGVIRKYSIQLLNGLKYLHENGIAHRDLKSANVLLDTDGQLKLTDFGSSKKFESEDECSKSFKGSPYWMSPEVVLRNGHSFSADIWSYGCVLVEMAAGRPPWSNITKDSNEVMQLIASPHAFPTLPKCSPILCELISSCLKKDPTQRPTPKEILEHPFHTETYNTQNIDS